ncbi:MAG: hypothetical protein AABZ92_05565, partial [Verrucomicrobiota bacterium]
NTTTTSASTKATTAANTTTTSASTKVTTTAANTTIVNNLDSKHLEWTPKRGRDAVKQITYGSMALLGLAITGLAYVIFGITKQKGGNGRGGHHRFKAENRLGHRHDPAKHSEVKPLNKNQNQIQFSRKNSNHRQRQGNSQV